MNSNSSRKKSVKLKNETEVLSGTMIGVQRASMETIEQIFFDLH